MLMTAVLLLSVVLQLLLPVLQLVLLLTESSISYD
jgi:hypothetical protein